MASVRRFSFSLPTSLRKQECWNVNDDTIVVRRRRLGFHVRVERNELFTEIRIRFGRN
jgi:hypothetical protein